MSVALQRRFLVHISAKVRARTGTVPGTAGAGSRKEGVRFSAFLVKLSWCFGVG